MRSLAVIGMVALTLANVLAEENSTRIVLVNSNIPNGAILKGINEHCHNLILTLDASKADYNWRHRSIRNLKAVTIGHG